MMTYTQCIACDMHIQTIFQSVLEINKVNRNRTNAGELWHFLSEYVLTVD